MHVCIHMYMLACIHVYTINIYMFLGPSITTLSGSQIKVCIF